MRGRKRHRKKRATMKPIKSAAHFTRAFYRRGAAYRRNPRNRRFFEVGMAVMRAKTELYVTRVLDDPVVVAGAIPGSWPIVCTITVKDDPC